LLFESFLIELLTKFRQPGRIQSLHGHCSMTLGWREGKFS
jgi:hypothetical protein